MALLIDGKRISAEIKDELKEEVRDIFKDMYKEEENLDSIINDI